MDPPKCPHSWRERQPSCEMPQRVWETKATLPVCKRMWYNVSFTKLLAGLNRERKRGRGWVDDSDLCRPRLSEFHGYMSPWVLKITCIRATMSTACIIILSIYKWHRRTSSTEHPSYIKIKPVIFNTHSHTPIESNTLYHEEEFTDIILC